MTTDGLVGFKAVEELRQTVHEHVQGVHRAHRGGFTLTNRVVPTNARARLLRDWIENDTFVWVMTTDILEEYTAVLKRLRVRPAVIGRIVNQLREEAEWLEPARTIDADPDPNDSPFWWDRASSTVTPGPDFLVRARDAGPTPHRR